VETTNVTATKKPRVIRKRVAFDPQSNLNDLVQGRANDNISDTEMHEIRSRVRRRASFLARLVDVVFPSLR